MTPAGGGTRERPWALKTPPGTSEFEAYRDEALDPPALVVQVGKTQLRYHLRCIEDLHAMLKEHGDWMPLGSADEQKPAAEGTVEAWGRSSRNPVNGWYGLKKGLRGRFGDVRAAGARGARPRRGRAQPEEQPDASSPLAMHDWPPVPGRGEVVQGMELRHGIPAAELDARRERLLERVRRERLTGYVLFDQHYIQYFTSFGFLATERPVVFAQSAAGEMVVLVPEFEVDRVRAETAFDRIESYPEYPASSTRCGSLPACWRSSASGRAIGVPTRTGIPAFSATRGRRSAR